MLNKDDGIFLPSMEGVVSGKTSQVAGMNEIMNNLIGNDNYLKGKKLDRGNYNGTAEDLSNDTKSRLPYVNNIEDLKKQTKYAVGDIVEVLGYYTSGDGAHHKRKIEATDDGSGVQLANGLYANIVHDGEVNVSWLGACKSGDCSIEIQKAIDFSDNLYFPPFTYSVENTIYLTKIRQNLKIRGEGNTGAYSNTNTTRTQFITKDNDLFKFDISYPITNFDISGFYHANNGTEKTSKTITLNYLGNHQIKHFYLSEITFNNIDALLYNYSPSVLTASGGYLYANKLYGWSSNSVLKYNNIGTTICNIRDAMFHGLDKIAETNYYLYIDFEEVWFESCKKIIVGGDSHKSIQLVNCDMEKCGIDNDFILFDGQNTIIDISGRLNAAFMDYINFVEPFCEINSTSTIRVKSKGIYTNTPQNLIPTGNSLIVFPLTNEARIGNPITRNIIKQNIEVRNNKIVSSVKHQPLINETIPEKTNVNNLMCFSFETKCLSRPTLSYLTLNFDDIFVGHFSNKENMDFGFLITQINGNKQATIVMSNNNDETSYCDVKEITNSTTVLNAFTKSTNVFDVEEVTVQNGETISLSSAKVKHYTTRRYIKTKVIGVDNSVNFEIDSLFNTESPNTNSDLAILKTTYLPSNVTVSKPSSVAHQAYAVYNLTNNSSSEIKIRIEREFF